jgi:hypothetical protein
MTITKLILMLVCLASIALETKEAKVTPLFSKDLAEFHCKEGLNVLPTCFEPLMKAFGGPGWADGRESRRIIR